MTTASKTIPGNTAQTPTTSGKSTTHADRILRVKNALDTAAVHLQNGRVQSACGQIQSASRNAKLLSSETDAGNPPDVCVKKFNVYFMRSEVREMLDSQSKALIVTRGTNGDVFVNIGRDITDQQLEAEYPQLAEQFGLTLEQLFKCREIGGSDE